MDNINDYMPLSNDWNKERLATLKELFPDLFTNEGNLNIDELKKVIDPQSVTETERYEFRWFGKSAAKRNAFTPSNATLQYDEHRSVNPNESENLIIEGENLEVLKLLSNSYRGAIKCIYIDPPYNTGGDFVYSDNFDEDKKPYWENTGVTENGVKVSTNVESSGRYHSNWLDMMLSRLLIAKQLLREDGVIFISIDDNEVHNLRILMNEVFGEENFLAQIIWEGALKNDSKFISSSHDYIICFCKSREYLRELDTVWRTKKEGIDKIYQTVNELKDKLKNDYKAITDELKKWYTGLDKSDPAKQHKHYNKVDERGVYFPSDASWPGGGGPIYDISHPVTNQYVKKPSRGWIYPKKETMETAIRENRIDFGEDETKVPTLKKYLAETEGQVLPSVIYKDRRAAMQRLRNLMDGDLFENPKDEDVIKKIIEAIGSKDEEIIIMDFFAGSGTTAQAVLELNDLDKGNRQFILVQIPEAIDKTSESYRLGYKKISDITIERNKRVIEKIITEKKAKAPDLFTGEHNDDAPNGLGFKVFKLVKSNFPRVEFAPDTEKTDEENIELLKKYISEKEAQLVNAFNRDELITEILLKNGFSLNYKVQKQDQFKKNEIFLATDAEKETLICLDYVIDPETVAYFKTHTDTKFICLERALDTTKKYSLKHYMGNMFTAF